MKEPWTGELIGRMHNADVTYEDLGNELGWGKPYIGMILNGQRNPDGAKEKMLAAFEAIVSRRSGKHSVNDDQSNKTDS